MKLKGSDSAVLVFLALLVGVSTLLICVKQGRIEDLTRRNQVLQERLAAAHLANAIFLCREERGQLPPTVMPALQGWEGRSNLSWLDDFRKTWPDIRLYDAAEVLPPDSCQFSGRGFRVYLLHVHGPALVYAPGRGGSTSIHRMKTIFDGFPAIGSDIPPDVGP